MAEIAPKEGPKGVLKERPTAEKPAECDLAGWYASQYMSSVGIADVEGGARFKQLTDPFPVPTAAEDAPFPICGRMRMRSFMALKMRYPLGPDGYTCVAMRASIDGASAHYAYLYWRRRPGAPPSEPDDLNLPEYICVSPTFDSRDGEYRRRFMRYDKFAATFEELVPDLAPFESAVIEMVADGTLELAYAVYPDSSRPDVENAMTNLRLATVAFAVAMSLDLWEVSRVMLMSHTNAMYVRLMSAIAENYPSLVDHEATRAADSKFFRFVKESDDAELLGLQCGQKIVPMYARETTQPFDLNLATWRELAVTRLAGDLALNFVSPAFALYNQWTYIEGADASLFENQAMGERFARGLTAGCAARTLREARRIAATAAPPGRRTAELVARIRDSLEYARSFIVMSPVAVMHTMEDVGVALRSVATTVRRAPNAWPTYANTFATLDNAAHFMFDIAYGAHCLHTKLAVAHTDLHGNNMTLHLWGLADSRKPGTQQYTPYYDDPVVAYVAGPRGSADTYVFPASGTSGCLIDNSRCILGPGFRPRLEAGRTPAYATHFYRDQVTRAVRVFHRYAPSYAENNDAKLRAAVISNFDAAFAVICAVDFIAAGRNVAAALTEAVESADPAQDVRAFPVAAEGIALARRLEAAALEVFMQGLHALVDGTPPPLSPGAAILPRVFADWLFHRWDARSPRRLQTAALVDAYNINNDLRFSESEYAKFPTWARLDKIEPHLGAYKMDDLIGRSVEPFLESLRPGARVELIAEQLRAELDGPDGSPASVSSSWGDD
jgi:hypothetical protein